MEKYSDTLKNREVDEVKTQTRQNMTITIAFDE